MNNESTDSNRTRPRVSVILPTYNRTAFLPAALQAIRSQHIDSWELVVVDDGSTDDTPGVIASLTAAWREPVRYIRQENQGAYGARNTGVAAARGDYIAFYDSDDVWLPHHLSVCTSALDGNADVDWVYAACEIVDLASGAMLDKNCFYESGRPRPFMRLPHETRGSLQVIVGRTPILCQIDSGLYCGLQNSVLRRRVFEQLRFAADRRNEAEDQLFAIRAVAAGFRLAYVDAVHVRYHVHGENSSGAAKDLTLEKRRRVYEPLIAGYEQLQYDVVLTPQEHRALRRRVGKELFWHLGYVGYWEGGARREALATFRRALRVWPWSLRQWKTFLLSVVRTRVSPGGEADAAGPRKT